MRYRRLRFDIWLCLALGVLLSFLTVKIADFFLPDAYESYVAEHTVAAGDIGGTADESVFRAQNISDLLAHETFTVISPGIEYRNRGGGYHNGRYMHALTLPSGERVAACINIDSVQNSGDSIYSGDATLPVGRLVYEDLSEDSYFLGQIEYSERLSRTDFYVDMLGNGGVMSQEDYNERPTSVIQVLTVLFSFPLLHMAGSKLGIFPAFFQRKSKQKQVSEWE